MKDNKSVKNRYYMIKGTEWNVKDRRPVCKVIECIGEAGNLAAESLRLLKMHDVCTESYEVEQKEESNDPLAGCIGPVFNSL